MTLEPRISFNNVTNRHNTVLEVEAEDRPGLLHEISSELTNRGCNIEVAMIATHGRRAVDVFYVTLSGSKLDGDQQKLLESALLNRISAA
jgi:[protein-PII] uridylyltransferase